MRRKFLLILALGFWALAGCEEYEYTIEMCFEDGRIVRKVICSENMPDEIRAKLKKIYEKQIDQNTFEGSFTGRLPQDVGGFGNCIHLSSPMGEAYIYHERFRGKDEQAKDLQHAFASVDKLLDLVIEWLEMELSDHPNFAKLKTFCTTQLRSDLKNICTYTWLGSRVSDPNNNEAPIRILQYLYEREYFTLDDIARLVTSVEDEQVYFAFARRFIAQKIGYENEEAVAKELSFLANEENILKSVQQFISTSDTIKKIVQDNPKKGNKEAPTEPNAIIELVMKQYEIELDTFFIDIFPTYDQVNVTLTLPHEPYETNGQWDEEKRQLTWSRKIRRDKQVEIPFLCYAAFTQPNEDYQKKHFGKTILKNEELTLYSFWHKGLTVTQQQEWDQYLDQIKNIATLDEKLKAFRFSDVPEPRKNSQGELIYLTDTALELFLEGVDK